MNQEAEIVIRAATEQASAPRPRSKFLRVVGYVLAALLLLAVLVFMVSVFARHVAESPDMLQRWTAKSAAIKRWGLTVQTVLLALIIVGWRPIVDWGRRRDIVKVDEYQRVLALRWHAALIGVAYLILIPIGPTTLWRIFFGA